MSKVILALDQGTTSSRAIVFSHDGTIRSSAQREFRQILPAPGIVEHDANEIWSSQLEVGRAALRNGSIDPADVAAIGIANQRETAVLWDRGSGKPVVNAVVWQSRASAAVCERLKGGLEPLFRGKTGLLLDAYFSGTKITHLFETPGIEAGSRARQILFGTVDSWLAWNLSGGKLHITDPSNASRTLLFNVHTREWDDELLDILGFRGRCCPVAASSEIYGQSILTRSAGRSHRLDGRRPRRPPSARPVPSRAAQDTFRDGQFPPPEHRQQAGPVINLLTTIGWQIGEDVTTAWRAPCSFPARRQWLRDGLGLISSSADVESLANVRLGVY